MPRSNTSIFILALTGTAAGICTPAALAQTWQAGTANSNMGGTVSALRMWDPDGPSGPLPPVLVAAGTFTSAGTTSPANRIATWDGSNWTTFSAGGLDGNGVALATLSSDNSLVVAGSFLNAGGTPTRRIARWNGSAWNAMDTGSALTALTSIAAVNSDTIVACGVFSGVNPSVVAKNIATWNSTAGWTALADGISSNPFVCAGLSNGNIIVSTGGETTGGGALTVHRIARWDGSWHPMGEGFTTTDSVAHPAGLARCLLEMPNGDVIAGGSFVMSGATNLNKIARWDHTTDTWMPLGAGINNDTGANHDVYALALMPNGDVIAGGDFTTAGGATQNYIARWKPSTSTWSGMAPADAGMGGPVRSLAVLPNGDLAVGGDFLTAGGLAAQRFAIWHEPAVAPPTPPMITVQPVSQHICIFPDGVGVFNLTATGTGLSYQWQQQDLGPTFPDFIDINDGPVPDIFGNPIFNAAGTTTSQLTLTDGQGYGQIFRCVVSNAAGHVDSTEVSMLYCHADINCSGALSIADIFDFLNYWFAGNLRADYDHINDLSIQDIFEFLNGWFEGCA